MSPAGPNGRSLIRLAPRCSASRRVLSWLVGRGHLSAESILLVLAEREHHTDDEINENRHSSKRPQPRTVATSHEAPYRAALRVTAPYPPILTPSRMSFALTTTDSDTTARFRCNSSRPDLSRPATRTLATRGRPSRCADGASVSARTPETAAADDPCKHYGVERGQLHR
jgi:hypothetical protein